MSKYRYKFNFYFDSLLGSYKRRRRREQQQQQQQQQIKIIKIADTGEKLKLRDLQLIESEV